MIDYTRKRYGFWAIRRTDKDFGGKVYSGLIGRGWWPTVLPGPAGMFRRPTWVRMEGREPPLVVVGGAGISDPQGTPWDARPGIRFYRTREQARRAHRLLKAAGLNETYAPGLWSRSAVVRVQLDVRVDIG